MTNAEAWFNIALCPRKSEGSLGRTAQDGHLDSHTAPELCRRCGGDSVTLSIISLLQHTLRSRSPPVRLQRQFGVKHISKPKPNKQTNNSKAKQNNKHKTRWFKVSKTKQRKLGHKSKHKQYYDSGVNIHQGVTMVTHRGFPSGSVLTPPRKAGSSSASMYCRRVSLKWPETRSLTCKWRLVTM